MHPGTSHRPWDPTLRIGLLFATLLLIGFPSTARSEWTADGVAVCTAIYNQTDPKLATDGAGGAIVTWQDFRPGGDFDIFVQRIDADGVPRWSANGVVVCDEAQDQKFPQLVSDDAGGAILVWKDKRGGGFDIYAQRVGANGQLLWTSDGILVCGATNTQQDPVVAPDGQGGAIIVWRDFRMGGMARLYAQRVNPAGQPLWAADGVPVSGVDGAWEPAMIPDGNGGAIFTWYDYRTAANNFDIYAQRITSGGATSWGANGVAVCTAAGAQYTPQLVTDGAGGVLITWWDDRTGLGSDIYAAHLTSAGASASGWPANGRAVCTAPWEQFSPQLVADGAGGAIITWHDQRDTVEIFAQRLTGAGATLWATDGIQLCDSPGTTPVGLSDGSGGAIVAWYGTPSTSGLDIVAQHVTGQGTLVSGWTSAGRTLSGASGDQSRPTILSDDAGGAIVAWHDGRNDVGDIYITRIVAPLPNLNATATPDGFTAPIVPRDQPNASPTSAPLPTILPGGGTATWLNWAVQEAGGAAGAAWSGRLLLDGVPVDNVQLVQQSGGVGASSSSSGSFVRTVNAGPVPIRGGRHTLTSEVDPDGLVEESNETDNVWSGQWIWAPTPLSRHWPQRRIAPPAAGNGALPNCDGFRFARTEGTAWVTSLGPHEGSDDYDLLVYDDYTNSQSGFSSLRKSSTRPAGEVEFVVGHGSGTPTTLYPAVIHGGGAGAEDQFTIDASDATGRRSSASTAHWSPQPLRERLADVYEGYFEAGETIYMTLQKLDGSPGIDLNIAVFPPTAGGLFGPGDAVASASPVGPTTWVLNYTVTQTGWHPIVVHRRIAKWVRLPLTYSFMWGSQVSAVGDTPGELPPVAVTGIAPNPMARSTEIRFRLAEAAPVSLRLYDVAGRFVRTLAESVWPAGEHAVPWDGRTDDGQPAAAGLYFARFESGAFRETRRITVTR